ncbi:MAG TPA: PLP-dependent transferase, partial [Opitutaceae bacterium]
MSVFTHLPLGQRIPASLHGVSCSLPTMRAVIGYEEKHPEIVSQMTSGYPRFVQHPFLKQASAHLLKTLGLSDHSLWLTSSHRAAEALRVWLGETSGARVLDQGGVSGVYFPTNTDVFARAKTFLQHTGML